MLFSACANIVAPQGGLKDVIAPFALTSVPTDSCTNFKSRYIDIYFSEHILLKDPDKNITISPVIKGGLIYETQNNKLRIRFKTLNNNTTYTINAKNSIGDLTEGNLLPNLKYIFSTGDRIDLNTIRGTVIDAMNLKPINNSLVCLYKNYADSLLTVGEPDYYSYTDEKGNFNLENISKGSFMLLCFDDKNLNKHWEPIEEIGFLNNPINIDSNLKNLVLRQFKNTISNNGLINASAIENNLYEFEFRHDIVENIKIEQTNPYLDKKAPYFQSEIISVCDPTKSKTYILSNIVSKDSVQFKYSISNIEYSKTIPISTTKPILKPLQMNYTISNKDSIPIIFRRMLDIDYIDFNKIIIKTDTHIIHKYNIFSSTPNKLIITPLKSGIYTMYFNAGAITDVTGLQNDSFVIQLRVIDKSELQSLILNLDSTFKDSYKLRISNNFGYCFEREIKDTKKIVLSNLLPGRYKIQIINSSTPNLYGGDFIKKIQPEKVLFYNEYDLKNGIDIEENIGILYP